MILFTKRKRRDEIDAQRHRENIRKQKFGLILAAIGIVAALLTGVPGLYQWAQDRWFSSVTLESGPESLATLYYFQNLTQPPAGPPPGTCFQEKWGRWMRKHGAIVVTSQVEAVVTSNTDAGAIFRHMGFALRHPIDIAPGGILIGCGPVGGGYEIPIVNADLDAVSQTLRLGNATPSTAAGASELLNSFNVTKGDPYEFRIDLISAAKFYEWKANVTVELRGIPHDLTVDDNGAAYISGNADAVSRLGQQYWWNQDHWDH